MPTLTINYTAGPVATKLGQVATAWFVAKHASDVPVPATPNAVACMTEMLRDYLRSVYQQATTNDAATTAQATVTAAQAQSVIDAGTIT